MEVGNRIVPVDLVAFGSSTGPRPPRASIDLKLDSEGMFGPETGPLPRGASAFDSVDAAPLRGRYHHLSAGTLLPDGLAVIADGSNEIGENRHPAGHYTIYPTRRMGYDEFARLFASLP